jgi:hypothetical protein
MLKTEEKSIGWPDLLIGIVLLLMGGFFVYIIMSK